MKRNKTETQLVHTTDNFYGNFPGDKIQITYTMKPPGITASGNDDYMLSKTCEIDKVRDLYRMIVAKSSITKKELKEMGFVEI